MLYYSTGISKSHGRTAFAFRDNKQLEATNEIAQFSLVVGWQLQLYTFTAKREIIALLFIERLFIFNLF